MDNYKRIERAIEFIEHHALDIYDYSSVALLIFAGDSSPIQLSASRFKKILKN